MKSYTVQFTEPAWASVHAQFAYIAIEKKSPLNGKRWLRRLLAATDSLVTLPRRFGKDMDFSAELGTDVYRMVFERTSWSTTRFTKISTSFRSFLFVMGGGTVPTAVD